MHSKCSISTYSATEIMRSCSNFRTFSSKPAAADSGPSREHFVFTDTEGLLYHFLIEGNMVKDGSKIPPDVRKTRRCVHVCSSGEPWLHTHVQSTDCCSYGKSWVYFISLSVILRCLKQAGRFPDCCDDVTCCRAAWRRSVRSRGRRRL